MGVPLVTGGQKPHLGHPSSWCCGLGEREGASDVGALWGAALVLTIDLDDREGRRLSRGLHPQGRYGHRRLSETMTWTFWATAPGGSRPVSSPLPTSGRRRRPQGGSVPAGSSPGRGRRAYAITGGEHDPETRPVRQRQVPGRHGGPAPRWGGGAGGPPGTLRSLIKSRGGGERGGRPRGRGRRLPGTPRCRRRAPLRALQRGDEKGKMGQSQG